MSDIYTLSEFHLDGRQVILYRWGISLFVANERWTKEEVLASVRELVRLANLGAELERRASCAVDALDGVNGIKSWAGLPREDSVACLLAEVYDREVQKRGQTMKDIENKALEEDRARRDREQDREHNQTRSTLADKPTIIERR